MKDEGAGVAIEDFVGLQPSIQQFLVNADNELRKAKDVNRNVVATIIHNKHKDVLLNIKSFRHSRNRIQSKDYEIGTYEINKIYLSCFDDKIYLQSNGYDGLALSCQC